VDPNEREERVMDGLLVIAMNKHREICTIQSSGGIMLLKDQVSALTPFPVRPLFLELLLLFCFLKLSF
jgi:exosome complex RNA-binding protein Rrp42 (RNase PH superfamily)